MNAAQTLGRRGTKQVKCEEGPLRQLHRTLRVKVPWMEVGRTTDVSTHVAHKEARRRERAEGGGKGAWWHRGVGPMMPGLHACGVGPMMQWLPMWVLIR